jgi:hypothetical protein
MASSSVAFTSGLIAWNIVDSGQGDSCRPVPNDCNYGYNVEPSPDGDGGDNNGITLYDGAQGWTIAQNDVGNFWHTQIGLLQLTTTGKGVQNNTVEHNEVHAEHINYAHGLEIISVFSDGSQMEKLQNNTQRFNFVHDIWTNNKHEGTNTRTYGNVVYNLRGTPREPLGNTSWGGAGFYIRGHITGVPATTTTGGIFAYNTLVDVSVRR